MGIPKRMGWEMCSAAMFVMALALLLTGCLYIPTPHAGTLEGTEVKSAQLKFLQAGQTTKEDVIRTLGKPTILWRDENIFVYRWVKLRGILLWAMAGGYSASAGAIDVSEEYAFLVKFDSDDHFRTSQIVEKPPLKSYGQFLLEWRDSQRTRQWQPLEMRP